MRRLTYALRFHGTARRLGPDGKVVRISTSASGCAISSRIDAEGLVAALETLPGEEATCDSEIVFTGETTFQQAATIVFGSGGHLLRVSTVGTAILDRSSPDGERHGVAIWRVDHGEGQFAGATGLITSSFLLTDSGRIEDVHVGLVTVES